MSTEKPMVIVEHLYKEFDEDTKVLSDINLEINQSEVVAILGPSGTGKSTLLRCLNYLTVPTKGIIEIGGKRVDAEHHTKQDIRELRQHSSMVFPESCAASKRFALPEKHLFRCTRNPRKKLQISPLSYWAR